MTRLVAASRAVTAAGLLALVVLGIPGAPAPGEPLLVSGATPPDTVAAILARDTAASLTWVDSLPPGPEVTELLAAAARNRGRVTLALPAAAGRLRLVAPDRPVAGRRAALRVSVRAEPDTEVPVTLEGPGGGVDTVRIPTGPDGRGAVSVAVEVSREGAGSWTARSPDATAAAHAWVRPPSPVRALVWSRTPGSESRYLVRALEGAGMEVEVRQELGRELAVSSRGAAAPRSLDDLAGYDVVALLGSPSEAADLLALRWVRERGGGLLLAGSVPDGSPLRPWAPLGPRTDRAASEIHWAGPAEIVPLPGAEILTGIAAVPPGGVPIASMGGDPIAHVAHLGRGRLFASGFESWPWVLRAGLGSAHQAFWESVAEWLAGGLTDETILVAEPALSGIRWEGRFEGEVVDEVVLDRVRSGSRATEALSLSPSPDGSARVVFVPVDAGVHELRLAPESTVDEARAAFGVLAVAPGEGLTWTASALRIGRAAGRIVPPAASGMLPGEDPGTAPGAPRPPGRPLVLPWLLFLSLGGIAVLGWALRRVRGLP